MYDETGQPTETEVTPLAPSSLGGKGNDEENCCCTIQEEGRRPPTCRRLSIWVLAIMVLSFLIGWVFYGMPDNHNNKKGQKRWNNYIKHRTSTTSIQQESLKGQTTCTAASSVKDDPLIALREKSSLEGLQNGAIATDHDICSDVGNSILQRGGNAVDAAISAILCLGVANPGSSGLGGGGFMLIHSDRKKDQQYSEDDDNTTTQKILFHDKRDPKDQDNNINFVLGKDNNKRTEVIDFRELAPAAATEDMFLTTPIQDASVFGGLSIGVPGELRGMEVAHARFGSLPWADIVEPAMKLARDGIEVSYILAYEIPFIANLLKQYGHDSDNGDFAKLRHLLTKTDNWEDGLKEGEIFKNPQLAKTLQSIMEQGADGFYTGENAKHLIAEIQEAGGILTEEDLRDYRPTLRSPLMAEVNGFTMVGVPPPSSGGATVIGAARFLSGYKNPFASAADTLSIHRMVEALRHAFAIRMSLSDPAFHSNVTRDAVHDLVSGSYMESLRKLSKDNDTLPLSLYGGPTWAQLEDDDGDTHANDHHEGDRRKRERQRQLLFDTEDGKRRNLARPFGYLEDRGTSHLSVVDKDGNAVSVTSSINGVFGSCVYSERTGVVLGNTMDDFGTPGKVDYFGLQPAEANFVAPGKKPLSSMSPTMLFKQNGDGEGNQLTLVVGGSGGPKIISAVLQVIFRFCMMGLPLFDSVAYPRTHEQLLYHAAAVTTFEKMQLKQGLMIEVSNRTREALLKRGHDSLSSIDYAGTVQAVAVDLETNILSAVSDLRKGGAPAGY